MAEETKHLDLLLVEQPNSSFILATAEAFRADVNCVVEFDDGSFGRVVKRAWVGSEGRDMLDLLAAIRPVYEAKAVYARRWNKEPQNAAST